VTSSDTVTRRHGDAAKDRESGYALLLIFAMAATIAVMLYVELPRVAFEKQRDREQVLIERGEQYKRAIQLYFRKVKNYPPSIEALENTNNVRFLRRRYKDPLTGKDEWRLIHVGPGGVFLDSITQKAKNAGKQANLNTFITEGAAIGSALPDNQRGVAGPPRRPSEGGQPQPGSDAGGVPGQMQGDPAQQGSVPGQPGGQTPLPGASPLPASLGGGVGQPAADPSQPAGPGAYTPGMTGNQPGMSPADLIGNLLRQPRQMPGATPGMATGMAGGGGVSITGGIAGVASKLEKHSIKIYAERHQYNEWEFIYDFTKDRTGAGRAAGGPMGSGDPRLANQGIAGPSAGQPGTFGMQPPSGAFGAQPGLGAQAGAVGGGAPGSSGGSSGGIGSGFGGSVGSGFGSQPAPAAPGQSTPGQHQPVPNPPQQQSAPEPGPIPPPAPPTLPPDQNEDPPQ